VQAETEERVDMRLDKLKRRNHEATRMIKAEVTHGEVLDKVCDKVSKK
jgi:hypothetical protein